MASPRGWTRIVSWAMAHLNTVRILCLTRLAVSGIVVHMGVRTDSTSARPIVSTGMLPIFGKACRSRSAARRRRACGSSSVACSSHGRLLSGLPECGD